MSAADQMKQLESDIKDDRIHIYRGYWSRRDVLNDPTSLYVYGDNDIRQGMGGQAIIRGLTNTHGIPTKCLPSCDEKSYYTDDDYVAQCIRIADAFDELVLRAMRYKRVVFSRDGLGTGLSELPERAPRTAAFLAQDLARVARSIRAQTYCGYEPGTIGYYAEPYLRTFHVVYGPALGQPITKPYEVDLGEPLSIATDHNQYRELVVVWTENRVVVSTRYKDDESCQIKCIDHIELSRQ